MSIIGSVSATTAAAVRHRHAAAHVQTPKVAATDADDVAKVAPVKVASMSPGQLLNKKA